LKFVTTTYELKMRKANKWMGDLNLILGIKGEQALVLILNHYMKVKLKNQIKNNNKLNIKQIK
jgi:hypothetical protein